MPFQITLEGRVYNTDTDLSVAETRAIEKELGRNWRELNPEGSAEEFQVFARVLLSHDHPADQAAKIADETPLGVALKAVKWVGDDLPSAFEDGFPKAVGGPSTTTSSGSPDLPTDGLPT